jgi:hypothetical protein
MNEIKVALPDEPENFSVVICGATGKAYQRIDYEGSNRMAHALAGKLFRHWCPIVTNAEFTPAAVTWVEILASGPVLEITTPESLEWRRNAMAEADCVG